MDISYMLQNWKTSSTGLLSIIGGVTRLAFAITQNAFTEEAVMTAATTILLGIGLLCARDVNVSSVDLNLQSVKPKSQATNVVVDKPDPNK